MSRVGNELQPGLPGALVATTWAVGLPLVAGALFLVLVTPQTPPLYLSALLTLSVSLAAAAVGTRIQSNFSELLLWNWLVRLHAERRLAQGTLLLDFDSLLHSDRLSELPRHDLKVLTRLAQALERKDLYTLGHSRRVARQACRIAAELGLEDADLEELAEAAALHDVGKIRVPDAVLQKKGPLTLEEYEVVQEHSEVGAHLVSAMGRTRLTAAVLHHHESWDGQGYPRGLEGEDIPLFARIIAVADAHDAMTSDRPYRRGMSHDDAVARVKEQAGRQFDPEVVVAFERAQRRHIVVPALVPALLCGRRLLRTALASGSAAASPAAAAATATAVLLGSGLAVAPTPKVPLPRRSAPLIAEVSPAVVAAPSAGLLRQPETGLKPSADRELSSRPQARAASPVDPSWKGATQAPGPQQTPGLAAAPAGVDDASGAVPDQGVIDDVTQAPEAIPELPPITGDPIDVDPIDPGSLDTPDPLDAELDPNPPGAPGHVPPGDPRPDKGKDCERRTGRGRGKDKHCSWA